MRIFMRSEYQKLFDDAVNVLRSNDRGTHTVPSPKLYPHQWAWDSAFAAIGWVHIDKDRALAEMLSLINSGWDDGRIPHINFDSNSTGYSPGPELWGCPTSSTITQPPVYAIALRKLYDNGITLDEIRPLVIALEKTHLYFEKSRDPEKLGLVAVAHPWESGLDNSPSWDEPLNNVNPEKAPKFERTDRKIVTDHSQRPTDDQYKRYLSLVREIQENSFGMGNFAVYDPMMTAILIKSEDELAFLADICGVYSDSKRRSERLMGGLITHLWNEEIGRFQFFDSLTGAKIVPDILASYIPLILKNLPENISKKMLSNIDKNFASNWGLPTTSPTDSAFDPQCYWRGPVWINMNWLLAPYISKDIIQSSLELVTRSGFREYYNPDTGKGLGAEEFTWTAALVIDWLKSEI
jgi:mannosylglycerate hydrolase